MEPTLKMYLIRLQELLDKAVYINKCNNDKAKRIRLNNVKNQLKYLYSKILKKVIGDYVTVHIEIEGEQYLGNFVNMSDEDIYKFYEVYSIYIGKPIKVNRISRIKTKALIKI